MRDRNDIRFTPCDLRSIVKHKSPQTGFTIVELLTAMGVLTIILFCIGVIFGQVNKVWQETTKRMQVYQNARIGIDIMTEDISNAIYQGAHTSTSIRSFIGTPGGTTQEPLDEVLFWTVRSDGAHQVGYRINNGTLERLWNGTAGNDSINWSSGYPNVDVIAYNAVNMSVLYWTEGTETWDGSGSTTAAEVQWPPSYGGKLPARVRIDLYMLSDEDAKKFAGDVTERRAARRIFSTEIDLPLRKWDK